MDRVAPGLNPLLPPNSRISSITENLLPSQQSFYSTREPASIYQEVLLSYRLLFGQTHKSRKLLGQILHHLPSDPEADTSRIVGGLQEDMLDTFLETLCTSPLHSGRCFSGLSLGKKPRPHIRGDLFPSSSLNVHDELIESDTYSARDDFPTFGLRLLALQRHNMRRQPSKVTDLWRDRRNPLQWYTFWAVIWVGGGAIVLALLQLVVAVVQMAYTIHPAEQVKRI